MFDVKLAGDTLRALAIAAGNDHHARAHAIAKARNLGSASKSGADDANTDSLICFHRRVVIPEQAYSAALCLKCHKEAQKAHSSSLNRLRFLCFLAALQGRKPTFEARLWCAYKHFLIVVVRRDYATAGLTGTI